MQEIGGLLDGAEDRTARQAVAGLGGRDEVPLLLPIEGGNGDATLDEDLGDRANRFERSLDPVVDGADHARPQLDRQLHAGAVNRVVRRDARRVFVDLDDGAVLFELDQLADEVRLADADQFEHLRVGDAHHLDDRAVDPLDPPYDSVNHTHSSRRPANSPS